MYLLYIYQVLNAFGPFDRSNFDLGADIGCDVFMFMILNSRTKFGIHYSCNDIGTVSRSV